MIKEAYVSLEVAKLLKEKGFNEATNRYYNAQYDEIRTVSDTFMTYWNSEEHMKVLMMEGAIAIPTHQRAMAWLREVHNLWLEISPEGKGLWYREVYSLTDEEYIPNSNGHKIKSYEDAVETALKYVLENLI